MKTKLFEGMIWIGFLTSLAAILIISRKNLALGLCCGAITLGLFNLPIDELWRQIALTLTDQSIILLTLAMGIIPLIGGTMKESGQLDSLVNNLRIRKRYLLALSAALMGLLPMPGGALLSAPILEKGGEGVERDLLCAINNWFRHLLILIYPLCPALIVSCKITGLDVYVAIAYILPGFALALILGHFFLLRQVNGTRVYTSAFSRSGLIIPLTIILCAPVIDFTLKRLFSTGTAATFIGVSFALVLSILLSRRRLDLKAIVIRMRPWNFALIILGMFLYLHIFQASDTGRIIAVISLPPMLLSVTAGFLLSLFTGRVQLPASIIFPTYLATTDQITPFVFALIYIAIYFGYIMSPLHPCLVVTCEYFRVPIKSMIYRLAMPTAIVIAVVLGVTIIYSF
jgi:integral membrane protein (TIGR00529 family)